MGPNHLNDIRKFAASLDHPRHRSGPTPTRINTPVVVYRDHGKTKINAKALGSIVSTHSHRYNGGLYLDVLYNSKKSVCVWNNNRWNVIENK